MKTLKALGLLFTIIVLTCVIINKKIWSAEVIAAPYIAMADNIAVHSVDSSVISGSNNKLSNVFPDKEELLTPMCEQCQEKAENPSMQMNNRRVAAILPKRLVFPMDRRLTGIFRKDDLTIQNQT
jgi:hypothetical protein